MHKTVFAVCDWILTSRSKVWWGRYGLTNQTLHWMSEIRLKEVRGKYFGPTSVTLFSHQLQHFGLSLLSGGKHEGWICPIRHPPQQETADGRCAAVGLLLPWPGWVCIYMCVSIVFHSLIAVSMLHHVWGRWRETVWGYCSWSKNLLKLRTFVQ